MNLTKLFETQRILDTRIELEHPQTEGEDRLAKKILALQVELGECANEWRGFKFWSNDQEARGYLSRAVDGVLVSASNPLLEEYVDCLHFILSIGLYHRFDDSLPGLAIEPINFNIIDSFTALMRTEWEFFEEGDGNYYHGGLELFIGLGKRLGFTWDQIETAYYDKNAINHTRQNTGY